jgi:acetyl-CoA carboxylase biotin carboxyl carrier protein
MIDIRKLKELVRLMVAHELTELDLRDSEEQVTLRRHVHGAPVAMAPAVWQGAPMAYTAAVPAAAPVAAPAAAPIDETIDEDEGLHRIVSPMVGTFYSSPSPDAAPFVGTGSAVEPETVVCIVEAMKIFNEIKAECRGTIERVLVGSGESVEFGQPLFLVRTD